MVSASPGFQAKQRFDVGEQVFEDTEVILKYLVFGYVLDTIVARSEGHIPLEVQRVLAV